MVPATPTLRLLKKELKYVTDWHSLGLSLDLEHTQLIEIERNHHDIKRRKTEMLGLWLKKTAHPTWEAVIDALNENDEQRVADQIQRRYILEGIVLLYMHTTRGLRCKFEWDCTFTFSHLANLV